MGLFNRQRSVAVETDCAVWQPVSSQIDTVPGCEMDDQGCAGDYAYGARFALASAPGATITVWCYPVYGPLDMLGTYQIGYRRDYHFDPGAGLPWHASDYDGDAEFYESLDECAAVARECAVTLAVTRRDGLTSDPDDNNLFFEWDGVPF
jgi:hypothetical protein